MTPDPQGTDWTGSRRRKGARTTGVGAANGVMFGRLVIGGLAIALIGFLALRVGSAVLEDEDAKVEALIGADQPDQHVLVRAPREPARVRLEADGVMVFDGVLPPGGSIEAEAHDRLVVDSSDLTRVQVIYNGDRVDPLGNQTAGRRLVFIDDIRR